MAREDLHPFSRQAFVELGLFLFTGEGEERKRG